MKEKQFYLDGLKEKLILDEQMTDDFYNTIEKRILDIIDESNNTIAKSKEIKKRLTSTYHNILSGKSKKCKCPEFKILTIDDVFNHIIQCYNYLYKENITREELMQKHKDKKLKIKFIDNLPDIDTPDFFNYYKNIFICDKEKDIKIGVNEKEELKKLFTF